MRALPLLFTVIGAIAGQTVDDGTAVRLVVSRRVGLVRAANGVDGELQLMQDARLTSSLQEKLWGTGETAMDVPFRNAVVRIARTDGTTAESKELERPLAQLESTKLYRDARLTYLLTVDQSAGMGSYSGPITFLVEVKAGRLSWLTATDKPTGKTAEIALMRSLKTVWKIVDAPGGSGKEILEALCRPNLQNDAVTFRLVYYRYYFDGKQWVRLVREQEGFSEFEDGFPARSLFP